mgnify:CR=1 FL=1
MIQALGYILLYLAMIAGLAAILFGVPGQFGIVAAVLVFILVFGSSVLPWPVFFVLLLLAVLAEVIEGIAGFLGAKSAKGSLSSSFAAIGGGLVGGVLGSMLMPVVGTILGALAGTFVGAFAVEFSRTRHSAGARRVAVGALIGRVVGSSVKVIAAFIMIVIVTAVLLAGALRGHGNESPHAGAGVSTAVFSTFITDADASGGVR